MYVHVNITRCEMEWLLFALAAGVVALCRGFHPHSGVQVTDWLHCEVQPSQKQSRKLMLRTGGSSVVVVGGLHVRQFNGPQILVACTFNICCLRRCRVAHRYSKFKDTFLNVYFIGNKPWKDKHGILSDLSTIATECTCGFPVPQVASGVPSGVWDSGGKSST